MTTTPVALFIDPISHHFEQDRLFDADANAYAGDRIQAPYAYLRDWFVERGVPVHTADRLGRDVQPAERNVYVSMGMAHRWPRFAERSDMVLSAFFALECPIVEPNLYAHLDEAGAVFRRLFSFSDGASLDPFLRAPLSFHTFRIPQSFDAVHADLWNRRDRGFLTMINANKQPRLRVGELYTERLLAVEHFTRTGDIDLYGVNWDGAPFRLGATRVPATISGLAYRARTGWSRVRPDPLLAAARRAWRGAVPDKATTLSRYDFAICFENMILPGWITEKIFDCFFTGTIPVYLGAPDIDTWVPPECFIDMRDFAGYDELAERLRSMGPRERHEMREAAREFVGSPRYRPFGREAFAELFAGLVGQDAGVDL